MVQFWMMLQSRFDCVGDFLPGCPAHLFAGLLLRTRSIASHALLMMASPTNVYIAIVSSL